MADQATVFDNPDNGKGSTTSDQDSLVATLVGEGRKYKTVDELAKAYMHVDEFVETLKTENAKLKDEVTKSRTLDEVLEQLKKSETPSSIDQRGSDGVPAKGGLTVEQIASIVREQVTGIETQKSKQSNLLKADALMKATFGEKAAEVFQKEATTPEAKKVLTDLASVSPEKFLAVFKASVSSSSTPSQVDGSTSTSTVSFASNSGRATDPSTKEFYDALRKDNPKAYYSQAMQLQMNKAAVADPAKFFGKAVA